MVARRRRRAATTENRRVVYARPRPPPHDRTVLISIISCDDDARAHTYATDKRKKDMVELNHIILNANKSNVIVPDPTDKPRISYTYMR